MSAPTINLPEPTAVLDYLRDNTTVVDDDCEGSILYCSAF